LTLPSLQSQLEKRLAVALAKLCTDGVLSCGEKPVIELTQRISGGEIYYATNLAMQVASLTKRNAVDMAQLLIAGLAEQAAFGRIEVASQGFINFHLNTATRLGVVREVLQQGSRYGSQSCPRSQSVQIVHGYPGSSTVDARSVFSEWSKLDPMATVVHVLPAQPTCVVSELQDRYARCGLAIDNLKIISVSALHVWGQRGLWRANATPLWSVSRALVDQVGSDTLRFFYTMRPCTQTLALDINIATSCGYPNPAYYVKLAHARCCSAERQSRRLGYAVEVDDWATLEQQPTAHLCSAEQSRIVGLLAVFPSVVERAANNYEPSWVTNYLRDLANGLHIYYDAENKTTTDVQRRLRAGLLRAGKQVLHNGLALINVAAPEVM